MVNKKIFDSGIDLLLRRFENDFEQTINNTFHQDINQIIQTLTNIILVERNSLIQSYIETENKNLKSISNEFNTTFPPLSKEQHTYFRGALFNLLTNIEHNAQIFYADRLSEEE